MFAPPQSEHLSFREETLLILTIVNTDLFQRVVAYYVCIPTSFSLSHSYPYKLISEVAGYFSQASRFHPPFLCSLAGVSYQQGDQISAFFVLKFGAFLVLLAAIWSLCLPSGEIPGVFKIKMLSDGEREREAEMLEVIKKGPDMYLEGSGGAP